MIKYKNSQKNQNLLKVISFNIKSSLSFSNLFSLKKEIKSLELKIRNYFKRFISMGLKNKKRI